MNLQLYVLYMYNQLKLIYHYIMFDLFHNLYNLIFVDYMIYIIYMLFYLYVIQLEMNKLCSI